jgi:hypothetical protein
MKMYWILCCMLMSDWKDSKNALPMILPCIPENFELSLATVASFFFDPDLCRNTMKYRNTHKRRDAAEIRLHFINSK